MEKIILLFVPVSMMIPARVLAHGVDEGIGVEHAEMMGIGDSWIWASPFMMLIWLVGGVLLIVWLWKNILRK
jgi:hypothetical protein